MDHQENAPPVYDTEYPSFPGLGGNNQTQQVQNKSKPGSWMNKSKGSLLGQKITRHGASTVKEDLFINANERKYPASLNSAFADVKRICGQISKQTQTNIIPKISSRDQSIRISITGTELKIVQMAKSKLRSGLVSQETQSLQIPKDYHKYILGKGGKQLRDLEGKTGTKVRIPGPNDTDATITITGSNKGIQQCKKEMQDIVSKSGNRATEKIDIPKMYHPFVSGAYNETKSKIESEIGNVTIHIPPNNKDISEITVVGDKNGVQTCIACIQNLIDAKIRDINEISFPIDKKSHKHIIGPKYSGIQQILKDHDVIVEVPDQASPDEKITLRGNQQKIGKALTDVYAMAHSHGSRILNCPKWCYIKLVGKKGENIKKLNPYNSRDNFVKVNFIDANNEIEILGKTETIDIVEKAIKQEINKLLRDFTVKEISIPQQHHGRIIGKSGANLKSLREGKENLNIRVPDNKSDKSDIITIEGKPKDVQMVYKELAAMSLDFQNEKELTLELDNKYHQYFFRDSTGRDKGKKEDFENIRNQHGDQVNIQFPNRELNSNSVKIRGPKEFVDRVAKDVKRLYDIIVQEHYEGKILIAKKFHKNIIGKAGANINKIKEECNVNIDIPANDSTNEVITVIGIKSNVERAKAQIRDIENQLGKISEVKVSIPKTAYRFLIGKDGNNITALRNQFDVAVQFPDEKDKSDQVVIRGEDKNVLEAKKKLIEMANDKIENYHTEEIACPKENRKFLVGKNGATRISLQKEYNCTLSIPDNENSKIQVTGKKQDVQNAIKKLSIKIKELSLLTEQDIQIPKKYHKRLITDKHINDINDETSCKIQLPPPNTDSDQVKVKGPKNSVENAIKSLSSLMNRFDNESELEVELPTKDRRALIGEGGSTVNNLQQKYDVFITIKPKNNGEDAEETTIAIIKGPQNNLQNVHEELKALVTYHEDYELPSEYHGLLLGEKGKTIQKLSQQLKVTIKVPKKQDIEDESKKDIIVLRGTTTNLANAKTELDKLRVDWRDDLEQMYLRSYTCPVEVPEIFHGKLIGQGGKHIADIQKRHTVKINIKKGNPSINITGLQENVHACVDEIVKFTEDLEQHVEKDVEINNKVHYRIIGQKGSKLRSLENQFNVGIKMPSRAKMDPETYEEVKNIIKVSGANDDVDLCIIELTNLEAEYQAEEGDEEVDPRFKPKIAAQEGLRTKQAKERAENNNNKNQRKEKYTVVDAPWSQGGGAANTNNKNQNGDAFPTLGNNNNQSTSMGAWASRK